MARYDIRYLRRIVYIVKISGGLGNQMFQYAFARALSLRKGVPFAMDTSWFESRIDTSGLNLPDKREFLLNRFNIVENYLRSDSSTLGRLAGKASVRIPLLDKLVAMFNGRMTVEIPEQGRKINIEKVPSNGTVLLQGYWQNYDYFRGHEDAVAGDFALKDGLTEQNRLYLQQIVSSNSVSVHFRRGDSLKEYAKKFYAMATMEYFVNAVELLGRRIERPVFFIFSNDTNWVKANFKINFPIVFIETAGPDYEHLHLMSRCKNNIIDNSSFSWWAAWLNDNPTKIVIAPEKLVVNPGDYHVVIPDSWLRLRN